MTRKELEELKKELRLQPEHSWRNEGPLASCWKLPPPLRAPALAAKTLVLLLWFMTLAIWETSVRHPGNRRNHRL